MNWQEVKNMLLSAKNDYAQLFEEDRPISNDVNLLLKKLSRNVPSNADFRSPQAMSQWAQAAALNAPMGLTIKNPQSAFLFNKEYDLYHGGRNKVNNVTDSGSFRSLFTSKDKDVALSHGKKLSGFKVNDKKIAKGWLDNDFGYDATKLSLDESLENSPIARDYLSDDDIYNAVVYQDANVLKDFYDNPELLSEIQALRADVARKLGYQAVDSIDEHGTSYQLLNPLKDRPEKPLHKRYPRLTNKLMK